MDIPPVVLGFASWMLFADEEPGDVTINAAITHAAKTCVHFVFIKPLLASLLKQVTYVVSIFGDVRYLPQYAAYCTSLWRSTFLISRP